MRENSAIDKQQFVQMPEMRGGKMGPEKKPHGLRSLTYGSPAPLCGLMHICVVAGKPGCRGRCQKCHNQPADLANLRENCTNLERITKDFLCSSSANSMLSIYEDMDSARMDKTLQKKKRGLLLYSRRCGCSNRRLIQIGKIGWLIMALLTPSPAPGFSRYYANVHESA